MKSAFLIPLFLCTLAACPAAPLDLSRLSTGHIPNAVEIVDHDGTPWAYVVSSGDATLTRFNLDNGYRQLLVQFATNTSPMALSISPNKTIAAVTLDGTSKIALVNLSNFSIVEAASSESNDTHPQGVRFITDDVLLASYCNYELTTPVQYRNGSVALFQVINDIIVFRERIDLNVKNPGAIVLDKKNAPWISVTGAWGKDDQDRFNVITDGALIEIQIDQLKKPWMKTGQTIALEKFAAGTPLFLDEQIVVPSQTRGGVALLPTNATELNEKYFIPLPGDGSLDKRMTQAAHLHGPFVAVAHPASPHLFVLNTETRMWNTEPYSGGVFLYNLRENGGSRRAETIAIQNGRGAALLSGSDELVQFHIRDEQPW